MIASLIYYGRVVRGLDFTLVSPLNEANLNGYEGPLVGDAQYTTILVALIRELDAMGQTQVRIVGPDTFNDVSYATRMMRDATVAARTDHLAFHTYSGPTSPGPSHPGKNYWLTETAVWCNSCDLNGAPEGGEWAFARDNGVLLLQDLANGFPAILVWEGYDSYWYHHDAYSTWGLLAYDRVTGVYTPRKRFYVNSQLTRFIRPGMVRTSLSTAIGNLTALAFHDAARGKVAIVGRNAGGAPVTINGQLNGVPAAVTSLAVFLTDSGSRNLQRGADVAVSGNTFSVTIPADTFFSLAN
jgi:O-glycosyl hydrolase